jgi:hypothetical protein
VQNLGYVKIYLARIKTEMNCDNKNFGGQSILRLGALCDKDLEKRGHSFLQTAAPIQATGGVTPVATRYQASIGATSL